jgi:hypothetical protein
MGRKAVNLIGQRFNMLTVISQNFDLLGGSGRHARWNCVCDCGKETVVSSSNLKSPINIGCGCNRTDHEDLTGQRFTKLVVLYRSGKGWNCQCDCGEQCIQEITPLKNGLVKSCGCRKKEIERFDENTNKIQCLKIYQRNAKFRNKEWKLTDDEFFNLVKMPCFYCGMIESNCISKKDSRCPSFAYNGIDRVINSEGYSIDNCVACCRWCNVAKSSRPIGDFVLWLNAIKQMPNIQEALIAKTPIIAEACGWVESNHKVL